MSFERAQIFRSLCLLQQSGVTIDRSLELLGRQFAHRPAGAWLARAANVLRSGGSLTQAARASQELFSSYHQALIGLGEKSGSLDGSLATLAQHEERGQELRQRLLAQLTYPALVFLFMLGFMLVGGPLLLGRVLPWYLLPTLMLSGLCLGVTLYRQRQRIMDCGPLRRLLRNWATAQFLGNWSGLLEQGVPLLTSLQLGAHASQDPACRRAVTEIIERLRAGQSLEACFQNSQYFSPLVKGAVKAGLECGRLPGLLRALVQIYEIEINSALEAVTALLSPFAMLLMGAILMVFLWFTATPMIRLAASL